MAHALRCRRNIPANTTHTLLASLKWARRILQDCRARGVIIAALVRFSLHLQRFSPQQPRFQSFHTWLTHPCCTSGMGVLASVRVLIIQRPPCLAPHFQKLYWLQFAQSPVFTLVFHIATHFAAVPVVPCHTVKFDKVAQSFVVMFMMAMHLCALNHTLESLPESSSTRAACVGVLSGPSLVLYAFSFSAHLACSSSERHGCDRTK